MNNRLADVIQRLCSRHGLELLSDNIDSAGRYGSAELSNGMLRVQVGFEPFEEYMLVGRPSETERKYFHMLGVLELLGQGRLRDFDWKDYLREFDQRYKDIVDLLSPANLAQTDSDYRKLYKRDIGTEPWT